MKPDTIVDDISYTFMCLKCPDKANLYIGKVSDLCLKVVMRIDWKQYKGYFWNEEIVLK